MLIQLRLPELQGKGDGRLKEKKKCLCIVFLADQKTASAWNFVLFLDILFHEQ